MRDAAYARHKRVFGNEHTDFVDAVYKPYFQAIDGMGLWGGTYSA